MKIQVESGKLLISLFLLTLATAVSSKTVTCPFKYIHHFGDGFTDVGNSIHVSPKDPNPARFLPYGITYPGWPTGRWCDGLVDFDFTVNDLGLPNIVPYLTWPVNSTGNDGVVFSVARSPVLSNSFFESRGISIPSYTASLSIQMNWFHKYLNSAFSSQQERDDFLEKSLLLMGDIEGNDIGYALTQGESIEEVKKTYVPNIVGEMINASRELLELGTPRVIIPGNIPIGCNPYILTALWTSGDDAYDELGCLKSVNELIKYKNSILNQSTELLMREFPNAYISYADLYDGVYSILVNASATGSDGINKALKSCCGIGGRYNFDSNRFCGSAGVPVCPNPNEYMFWDGYHFTQQAYYKIEHLLLGPALPPLNCTESITLRSKRTSSLSASF